MKKHIKGIYKKNIFKSDNGYIIGLFKVTETNDDEMKDYLNKTITFTGYFPSLNEDDHYFFIGEPTIHPKYGFQYQVNESELIKPEDKDGIIEFLSSDLFKGVGIKLATKIVETLGEDTLDKIINDKSCLMLVPKLTQKKADTIYDTLIKYEESHKIVVYLTELGFSMKDALLVYNTYRSNTINYIEHNIYNISDDIKEINFLKLDKISPNLKIEKNDPRRIKAIIYYALKILTFKTGNSYLDFQIIQNSINNYLNFYINEEEIYQYLNELSDEEKLIIIDDKYYLSDIYKAEEDIVQKLKILTNHFPQNHEINKLLLNLENQNRISYNKEQKEAIKSSLQNNITIITGGPGTGKSTIIKAIVELYILINKLNQIDILNDITLVAPTGRASKRMAEISNVPATTIHRFLKWNKEMDEFAINEDNKSKTKLVIVDEVSMIDTLLFDSLLKGLKDNVRLVLVGDYYQLPSVASGQILKDLIESKTINTINLTELYRRDEESYINVLAYKIKEVNIDDSYLLNYPDYEFIQSSSSNIKNNIRELCLNLIKKGITLKDIQVMAPIYRGINGIDSLNKELQDIFNPPSKTKKEFKFGDIILRENDKVLQLVNLPDENIFNGDIGFITKIEKNDKKIDFYINFEDNLVKYQVKDLINIKHGFAITIHKSQGSEFNNIIMPICYSYRTMLYNKLIYTGITRAKKQLYLIGDPNAFYNGIHNTNDNERITDLKNKLMYNLENIL